MDMKDRITQVFKQIQDTAVGCGRSPESVRLIAVSKTKPTEAVRSAIEAGATDFGENYIQEAREKSRTLSSFPVSWHFIGHLQSNKAKYAVRIFDLIHSVDSLKLAVEIDKQARKIDKIQRILIQVNVAGESGKSGVSISEAEQLIAAVANLTNIRIQGLMTMPPYTVNPETARPHFQALRMLRDRIGSRCPSGVCMDELSMGMTGDYQVAIEEGATLVRIGTAIFGSRQ
ncbi:MAG: YggS family pyridoxal phosphate-dependent enzyme [Deltaproteobacteria bacterium]|nr:YggS family pyridoxal phosphate-dependent enzyme [Deltaproteobacteria bacterium]